MLPTMRRFAIFSCAVLLTAPALLYAAIEGWIGLEPPPNGRAPFAVQGWAVSSCGGPDVTVRVDGSPVWRGVGVFDFPGVREKFGNLPDSARAGFWMQMDPSHFTPGTHTLDVVASHPECGERIIGSAAFPVLLPTPWTLAGPALLMALLLAPFLLAGALKRLVPGVSPATRVALIFCAEAGILIIFIVAVGNLAPYAMGQRDSFFAPLANWDGQWYQTIARVGYGHAPDARAYAYFPLYPLLMRALSWIPLPLPLLGALLNLLFYGCAGAVLRRLYPDSGRGLLTYGFLPFAFFFCAAYTEALFLLLSAACLLAVRRDAPIRALILGALAGITRPGGILLSLFSLDALRERRWRTGGAAALGPALGLAAWCGWLWASTGDPLKFLHAQSGFGRAPVPGPGRLWDAMMSRWLHPSGVGVWEAASLAAVLVLGMTLLRRGRAGEGAYCMAVVLQPLAILSLPSLNRYALAAFPAWIHAGDLIRKRALFAVILIVEALLLFYYAQQFARQVFVG